MKAKRLHVPCLTTLRVCLTLLGGAVTAARAEPAQAAAPEPGTRDYFEQKIKGATAFCQDKLIPITEGGVSSVPVISRSSRPLPPGLTRTGMTSPSSACWLEGRALQVLGTSLVVIGRPVTNALGVVTYTHSGVVALTHSPPVQSGGHLRILAVTDGTYQYQTASATGTLTAYREVAEPTFEEYLKVYESDRQAAVWEPIISVERAEAPVPTLVRPAAVVPAENAPPSDVRSYMERLRERKRQEEAQVL